LLSVYVPGTSCSPVLYQKARSWTGVLVTASGNLSSSYQPISAPVKTAVKCVCIWWANQGMKSKWKTGRFLLTEFTECLLIQWWQLVKQVLLAPWGCGGGGLYEQITLAQCLLDELI
jgi:hypothetical protein